MPEAGRNSTVGVLIGATTLMTISGGAAATTDSAMLGAQTTGDNAIGGNSAVSELADVVVTARRRTELAQDVPIPIATIGGADLSGLNQTRLEDLRFTECQLQARAAFAAVRVHLAGREIRSH